MTQGFRTPRRPRQFEKQAILGQMIVAAAIVFAVIFGAGAFTARTLMAPVVFATQTAQAVALLPTVALATPAISTSPLSPPVVATASAATVTSASVEPQLCVWTVQPGDTVWAIALAAVGEQEQNSADFKARVDDIIERNKLTLLPNGVPVIAVGLNLEVHWTNSAHPYIDMTSVTLPDCRAFLSTPAGPK